MLFKVPTKFRELSLRVKFYSAKPLKIFIVGLDEKNKNTEYFKRFLQLKGEETFLFKLPKSPKELTVLIYDVAQGYQQDPSTFKIISIEQIPLKKVNLLVDPLTKDFFKFAEDFALKCGYLPAKTYTDNKSQFKIELHDKIMSSHGKEMNTPARISVHDSTIQVSKKHMSMYTIPIRIAILGHEYSHNFINKDDNSEQEADYNSLKMYLSSGYPYIEAIYAYANVLGNNNDHQDRINYILRFTEKHQFENEAKNHGKVFDHGIIH
jgi:hypothetical protein